MTSLEEDYQRALAATKKSSNPSNNAWKLIVTPEQQKIAKTEAKATAIILMDPNYFLDLTTLEEGGPSGTSSIRKAAASIADYNRWSKEGEILMMPMLKVDRKSGEVIGHEGRHRAAAVLNAGGAVMPVTIILANNGRAAYYEQLGYAEMKKFGSDKRYYDMEDIPRQLTGQFRSHITRPLELKKGRLQLLWKT